MTAGRLILPVAEPVLDANGAPQVGATLTVYQNETTTAATIYGSPDLGGSPIANPQTSDDAGRFFTDALEIWADSASAYSVKLDWPDGTTYTFDNLWLQGETLQSIPYATEAEAEAGTATDRVISPETLAYVLGLQPQPAAVPTGMVITMAGTTPPIGYLPCDGSAVSRSTYSALWTYAQSSGVMASSPADHTNNPGKFYIGDGSTTFNVPNYGGAFPRLWASGQTIDSGRLAGTNQADAFKAHTHPLTPVPIAGSGFGYSGSSGVTGSTLSATGSTGDTETRPINAALPAFIKT